MIWNPVEDHSRPAEISSQEVQPHLLFYWVFLGQHSLYWQSWDDQYEASTLSSDFVPGQNTDFLRAGHGSLAVVFIALLPCCERDLPTELFAFASLLSMSVNRQSSNYMTLCHLNCDSISKHSITTPQQNGECRLNLSPRKRTTLPFFGNRGVHNSKTAQLQLQRVGGTLLIRIQFGLFGRFLHLLIGRLKCRLLSASPSENSAAIRDRVQPGLYFSQGFWVFTRREVQAWRWSIYPRSSLAVGASKRQGLVLGALYQHSASNIWWESFLGCYRSSGLKSPSR